MKNNRRTQASLLNDRKKAQYGLLIGVLVCILTGFFFAKAPYFGPGLLFVLAMFGVITELFTVIVCTRKLSRGEFIPSKKRSKKSAGKPEGSELPSEDEDNLPDT